MTNRQLGALITHTTASAGVMGPSVTATVSAALIG